MDQHVARKSLLVVDGDRKILRILDVSLRNAGFDVRTSSDGLEAAASVEATPPHLIISDTELTSLDGFELCRRLKQKPEHAAIPFIFLATPRPEDRLRGIELGADDFLSKPVHVGEVVSRARMLLQRNERARLERAGGQPGGERFAGELADFALVDLLQTVEASRRSGIVHLVNAAATRAEIYFRQGQVVDAEVGRLSGREAIYRLFSWTEGKFAIEWKNIRRKDTVELPPAELLMEGMRRLDQWTLLLQEMPPLDTVFEVDYRVLADRLAEIPDEVNGILRLLDGARSFIQVIDQSGLADTEALTVIGRLYSERIIRDVRARAPNAEPAAGPELEGWFTEAAGPFGRAADTLRADRSPNDRTQDDGSESRSRAAPPRNVLPSSAELREQIEELFAERLAQKGDHGVADAAPGATGPVGAAGGSGRADEGDGWSAAEAGRKAEHESAIPQLRPEEPGVLIQFPAANVRSTLISPASGPDLASSAAGEFLAPAAHAAASLADARPVAVPESDSGRTTHQGFVPASPPGGARVPPPEVRGLEPEHEPEHEAELQATSEPEAPPEAEPPSRSRPKREPEPAAPATRGADDLPFSQSANQWMTEGDEIHKDVTRAEALDEMGLPSRMRGLILTMAGMAALAGILFAAARFTAGSKKPSPAATVAEVTPALPPSPLPTPAPTPTQGPAPAPPVIVPQPPRARGPTVAPLRAAAEPPVTPTPAATVAPTASAPQPVAPAVATKTPPAAEPGAAKGAPAAPAAAAAPAPAPAAAAAAAAGDFPRLLEKCKVAFGKLRIKEALAACAAAKDANPASAEAHALLAHTEFNRGRLKEALVWAEAAVKINPDLADAYVIIGGVQQDSGQNKAARAAYKKYLELAPRGQYAADLRAIVDTL
jgi:DNA-binding response OmpR family regulator